MERVTLLLKSEDRAAIQALADLETEGKLNVVLRKLIKEALAMRKFPQRAVMGVPGGFGDWPGKAPSNADGMSGLEAPLRQTYEPPIRDWELGHPRPVGE